MPLPVATPKPEGILGGSCRDLRLLPWGTKCVNSDCVATLCLSAPHVTSSLVSPCLSSASCFAWSNSSWSPVSFLGLPVFRPHFYRPPHPSIHPQCGGGLWRVHVCMYICICDTLGSVSCVLFHCPKNADGWRSHWDTGHYGVGYLQA